jgi:large subunit ribosomal protein L17
MRHKNAYLKFSRTPAHRRAMLRNLVTNLVLHNRIETTLPKAKALKRVADKLITLGKQDTLHRRRQAMSYLFEINREEEGNSQKRTAVHKLFTELAPRYEERNGGYTRVVRTRKRAGDNAQLAVIEFVEAGSGKTEQPVRKKRQVKKSAAAEVAPTAESSEDPKASA